MAVVAGSRERVVSIRKSVAVLLLDGGSQVRDRLSDHPRDRVLWRDRRILVRWMELDDVVEALAELVDFVGGQFPILRLSGEPELHVSHLLKSHHLAQAGNVRLRRRAIARARRPSTCRDRNEEHGRASALNAAPHYRLPSPAPLVSFPFASFRTRPRCTRSSAILASSRARANASPYRKPASNSATPALAAASGSSSGRSPLIASISSWRSVAIIIPSLATSSSGSGCGP